MQIRHSSVNDLLHMVFCRFRQNEKKKAWLTKLTWSVNLPVFLKDLPVFHHEKKGTEPKSSKIILLQWKLLAFFGTILMSFTCYDIWTASSEFGTYRLCEQWRFRRACASAQSRQNLRCSLIQAVSQEEPSDRKPDPWPLWMAGHAQLKFVMTECSKTQIRLTGPIYNIKEHLNAGDFAQKYFHCEIWGKFWFLRLW